MQLKLHLLLNSKH